MKLLESMWLVESSGVGGYVCVIGRTRKEVTEERRLPTKVLFRTVSSSVCSCATVVIVLGAFVDKEQRMIVRCRPLAVVAAPRMLTSDTLGRWIIIPLLTLP